MASFVLPVNYLVANVSRRYDDREMIVAILGVMLAGLVGFLVYSGIAYSETRFICASFIIFCSCNAVEAPTMGLLSKTIPKRMASGILNAGLLATEAGTIGRVVGDFYFSAAAYKGLDRGKCSFTVAGLKLFDYLSELNLTYDALFSPFSRNLPSCELDL